MNLNQITECAECGERCHTVEGPGENPVRVLFDCGSIVEAASNEYGYHWAERCGKGDRSKMQGYMRLCRRCGSMIKSTITDKNDIVLRVDYLCGSTLKLASNQMWEFDGLCRHNANPKPVLHLEVIQVPSKEELKLLEESSGYVVVPTTPGTKVRILSPEPPLASVDEIGMAALEAMQGPTNDSVRAKFAEILWKRISARTQTTPTHPTT